MLSSAGCPSSEKLGRDTGRRSAEIESDAGRFALLWPRDARNVIIEQQTTLWVLLRLDWYRRRSQNSNGFWKWGGARNGRELTR
jgi:hypothetical protein